MVSSTVGMVVITIPFPYLFKNTVGASLINFNEKSMKEEKELSKM